MRKNILLIILMVIFITGCNLNNNPTSKVEELLSNYQKLEEINVNYIFLSNTDELTDEQKDRYNKLIEEQYKNLSYEIKNEEIDGNEEIITTEVEVKDYKKVIDKYDMTSYSVLEYHNLILDELENTKDNITYTIYFKVIKEGSNWNISNLSSEDEQKLLGIY